MEKNKVAFISDLMLAAVALIWGLGFPVTQMAIDAQLSSGLIVALRFLIAAAVMGIIFRREVRTITPRDALLGCVAGLILGMAFLLQVMGQSMTTPSNSAFLTSLNIIIVPFLSWGFFHQRPTRKMLLVALGCLVGALVLTLSPGEGLQLGFGDLLVLDDMSFNIRKGEFVCVVGPTGCGKTTFLNCLTRIHMPSEGDLYIDGVPADPRKHNISFVFQEPSALPWLTVEDNLAYGLKIKRIPKAEIDRRVNQILDLMGLQEFRKAYPGELSVSAEQRIIIGRSFAMQPDLLLMDEPYGQMDVKMRFYLEDEVIRLWKELGSTVVFITHNIEEAVYLAERVLILSNKPAKIKEEVRIDLPRPRDITSSQFIEYRNYITDKIKWW